MSQTEIKVEGGAELTASLHRAAGDFSDMERPGDRTGDLIGNRARVVVPRLTGALASSITTETDDNTTAIMSALPYAGRTHYGWAAVGQKAQPFILDPATQMMDTWVGYYEDEADRILHTVRGA